jgi:hypothetical protein
VRLAGGYDESKRTPHLVGQRMNLGRPSAA